MPTISLKSLAMQQFKSFVQPTVFTPSAGSGLKFISGRNLVEPALGANGAGKTTLFDALAWCLYGSSIHGARTSQLVATGGSQAQVAARLDIDGTGYEVLRYGPPERLAIDGELVEQSAVDRLIGLRRGQFLHSVIFGQGAGGFYDLSVPERGLLLDDVLDLGIWLRAGDAASSLGQQLSHSLQQARQSLAYAQGQLAGLADDAELCRQQAQWQQDQDAEIERVLDELEQAEQAAAGQTKQATAELPALAAAVQAAEHAIDALRTHQTKTAVELRRYADQQAAAARLVAFYGQAGQEGWRCPTCRQPIGALHARQHREHAEQEQEQAEQRRLARASASRREQAELDELLARLAAHRHDLDQARLEQARAEARRAGEQRRIELLAATAHRLVDMVNPYTDQLERQHAARRAAEQTIAEAQAEIDGHSGRLALAEWWKSGFKKLRIYQLKRVLDGLALATGNAADALGLLGWRIAYTTELETKAGTLSSRLGVHITVAAPGDQQAREYSPGELQRVRLAVASGVASLIQDAAGVYWTLEAWDEPTHWLSQNGIDNMLDFLQRRAAASRRSLWLIDPRSLDSSSFAEIWQVTKDRGGSYIERLRA